MIRAVAVATPRQRRRPEGFYIVAAGFALAPPLVLLLIVLLLWQQAAPAIGHFGLGFLASRQWNPVASNFGALPFIVGTVATSLLALAMALPIGLGAAIFLAEPGAAQIRGAIGVGVELLAAIPSVVYGLWALYVLAPWLARYVEAPGAARLGSIPLFAGPARQANLLTASVVLAVMILPTLAAVSRDVVKAVPNALRESAFALGATWWEVTWRVVLPAARGGIFGAVVLALGRALGETIAVTMVIGNRPDIPTSLFAPAYTLASVIANEFTEATGQLYSSALVELGLVLMLVTLAVNGGAQLLVYATTRGPRR
jgi:phosphate transport system permease protein